MAFLKFRGNTTSPAKPASTTAANAPLSNIDIDGNFASLNDTKLELTGNNLTIPGAYNINGIQVLSSTQVLQMTPTSFIPTSVTASNVSRTSNVVTVTTTQPHGFSVGHVVSNVGTSTLSDFWVNAVSITSVPTSTTFTYTQNGVNASTSTASYYRETGLTSFVLRDSNGKTTLNDLIVNRVSRGQWQGNTILANYGGTGIQQYSTGDILYASGTNTLARLAKGTDGQVLKLASGVPSWAADTNTDTLQSIAADTTNTDRFITFVSSATGAQTGLTHTKLLYNPSTSTLSSDNFNSTSDLRLKKDLENIDFALAKLKTLTGYTFTMTESNTRSTGLIAQDVEKILPEAIGGNEEKKTLNYGAMLGLVVEAIKELDNKLEDIRNTILNK